MITPNAKCVVNGKKLNSLISAYNDMLTTLVSEEFDVVVNNYPDKRYLVTGNLSALVSGQSGEDEGSERGKLGGTGGGTGQGTASTNRDQLNTNPAGGGGALKDDGGVAPPVRDEMPKFNGGGGALKDDGTTTRGGGFMVTGGAGQAARDFDDTPGISTGGGAFGGGTDAFGNELYADGTRVTPGGMGGALKDDGTTTAGGGDSYPPPKVGAPPLTGEQTKVSVARSAVKAGPGSNRADELRRLGLKKRRQERWNRSSTKKLMDQQTAKRQKEADRQARINQMGGKYSPYARGRG